MAAPDKKKIVVTGPVTSMILANAALVPRSSLASATPAAESRPSWNSTSQTVAEIM
jgi:hypothetical protein